MDNSELIMLIGYLAADAGNHGAADVKRFWTSVAAKLTSDSLSRYGVMSAKRLADAPAQAFTLTAKAYYDYLIAHMSGLPQAQREKQIELIRSAINASQANGGISVDQADMLRRVTGQVEAEIAGRTE